MWFKAVVWSGRVWHAKIARMNCFPIHRVWWFVWHICLYTLEKNAMSHQWSDTQTMERRAVFCLGRNRDLCISLKPRWYPDVGVACIILHKTETQPQPLIKSGLSQSKTAQLFPALGALEPLCPICCCSGTNLRVWGGSCAYLHMMGHQKRFMHDPSLKHLCLSRVYDLWELGMVIKWKLLLQQTIL